MYSQGPEYRGAARPRQEKQEYGSVYRGQRYDDDDPVSKVPFPPSTVYFWVGLFVLGMLCLVPVWNAIALKYDKAFLMFLGTMFPNLILLVCFGVLLLYAFAICCFVASHSRMQSDSAMLTIGTCFLTLFGVSLLVVSSPLRTTIYSTANDIWANCQFGPATHEYYDAAVTLNALRAQPECKELPSVELCEGYVNSPSAAKLKEMEVNWHCSGFCYENPNAELQGEMAALGGISLPFCRDAPPPCKTSPFPPTLFSQTNDEVSCDGIAARDINTFGKEVADQSFYEGVCLVIIALLIALARLLGMCSGHTKFSAPHFPNMNMRIRGRAPPPVQPSQKSAPQPPPVPPPQVSYIQYSEPVNVPQMPPGTVQSASPPVPAPVPVQYVPAPQPQPAPVQYMQYTELPVSVQYAPSPISQPQFVSQPSVPVPQPEEVIIQQQPQYVAQEVFQQQQQWAVQQQQPQYSSMPAVAAGQVQQQQQQPQYGSMPAVTRTDPVFTP